jgi:deazaflavin-dependent oxidoreductase (nitroreductase family)
VIQERTHNPFLNSAAGGRTLSALQQPGFTVLPPRGFGVLTMTGRVTGKTRRKCVRAIRSGDKAYLVAIKGMRTAWLKNVLANPEVRLRLRGGWFSGVARELRDEAERRKAREAYVGTVNPFDYAECLNWLKGWPTRTKIRALHGGWFENGVPLVVELGDDE